MLVEMRKTYITLPADQLDLVGAHLVVYLLDADLPGSNISKYFKPGSSC